MNVLQFIDTRKSSWTELERIVRDMKSGIPVSQDDFRNLTLQYRAATSDFAFAQTHFPDHDVARYLNKLVASCHGMLYQRKRIKPIDFFQWLTRSVPAMFWENGRTFLFAFVTFAAFFIVGFWGSRLVPEGEKVFLLFSAMSPQESFTHSGNYISDREADIKAKRPFYVYESSSSFGMSGTIMSNNIMVAIYCFVGGVVAGIITFWFLATTGMMVGAFYHIYHRHDLSFDWWNTVMLHGLIELSMIIIAAACGFMIAKAMLFPGRFTRTHMLKVKGSQSVQIALVAALWLVIAAFFEGYVTGAHLPWRMKMVINFLSLSCLISYWGVLGYHSFKRGTLKDAGRMVN